MTTRKVELGTIKKRDKKRFLELKKRENFANFHNKIISLYTYKNV
jgi:hypothetical protein